jgi:ligand-binding sensor domain-containing protein/signal transduction histidine kinase
VKNYLILLICLTGSLAFAQEYRVEHIGINDGMSQGSPYQILKDSRGFMWFGTQDGVNRYDGHNFNVYKPSIKDTFSLHGVNIAGLVEDLDGNIWIGTEEGLNCFERTTEHFVLIATEAQKSIKRRTAPFFADASELWYLREGDGILTYNFKSKKHKLVASTTYITQDFDYIDWTTKTPFGDIWMTKPRGIVRYSISQKKYFHYFINSSKNQLGPEMGINCVYVDKQNIAWLGSEQGLIRLDYLNNTFVVFKESASKQKVGSIFSISAEINGKLWIGTDRNNIWNFDPTNQELSIAAIPFVTPRPLSDYEIKRIYVDNRNLIWANTDPDGMLKIVPNVPVFQKIADAPELPENRRWPNYSVRSMAQDAEGNIWVGTEGGIVVLDDITRTVKARYLIKTESATMPAHNTLKYILRDKKDRMWVGTFGGVYAFNAITKTFKLVAFDNNPTRSVYVRNMLELPNGQILIGTPQGMWFFDPDKLTYERIGLFEDKNVFTTFQDKSGTIWLAPYFEGLYAYTYQNKKWKQLFSGLKAFNINMIREDTKNHTLWIGTEKGLVKLNPTTSQFKSYGTEDGLANSYIYSLAIDHKQNVWMSSNRGISVFDTHFKQFRNFDLSDGVQGYEFNGNANLVSNSGEIFFGGVNGLNSFFSRNIGQISYKPRVHLYNFKVNENSYNSPKHINETDDINLDYDENTFSLEFAALDYYSNGQNQYQYMLEGQDKNWVMSGKRNYVRYASLTPSQYIFRVKAANRDGIWGDEEHKLIIIIAPPIWQRWWFYILLVSGLSYIAYLITTQRIKKLQEKEQERLKIALDAQEQERKQIAQDLHDEVGARLATLKLYASSMTKYLNNQPEAQEMKAKTIEAINDSIVDIRRLLSELSPRIVEQYGYTAGVEELAYKITQTGQMKMEIDMSRLPERLPANIEIGLYRITQELFNNTLKHAEAQKITVRTHLLDNIIHLDYFDDGKGFEYSKAKQGLGTGNIESRVALLKGQIVWSPKVGEGNAVFIQIPLN